MDIPNEQLQEITEGKTKLLVPKNSLTDKVPPMEPAFFNPRAKITRDFSLIVYSVFLQEFPGPKIFLEGLAGIGARGLRVANELSIDNLVINDLNPTALDIARYCAKLNEITNVEFSEKEVCRFLSHYSKRDMRGSIVDIDPFGSPAAFFDCGIRATMHGGILSSAATDLQVLNGIYDDACKRKYGGVPVRCEYGNEIAIRLILGCLRAVSARLGVQIVPIFAESDMHYYRTFVRVLIKTDQEENLGYILHCKSCGHRKSSIEKETQCDLCGQKFSAAGPLWIGEIFEKSFVEKMIKNSESLTVDASCQKTLQKCATESQMPPYYFTVDEIAKRMKVSPPKLEKLIESLKQNDFQATVTSFAPTGFRTNANIKQIISVMESIR